MTAAKSLRHPIQLERLVASVIYPDFSMPSANPAPLESPQKTTNKIALPTMEGLHFEKTRHILYLEASGNYTMIHFEDGRQVLVCKTLREVENMVPMEKFVRIHRSHTIQMRHLKKYIRGKGGYVVLQNGATLAVSSGQKEAFLEAIQTHFG
jgi:two-component system, LytTR family, response regulator